YGCVPFRGDNPDAAHPAAVVVHGHNCASETLIARRVTQRLACCLYPVDLGLAKKEFAISVSLSVGSGLLHYSPLGFLREVRPEEGGAKHLSRFIAAHQQKEVLVERRSQDRRAQLFQRVNLRHLLEEGRPARLWSEVPESITSEVEERHREVAPPVGRHNS